MSGNAEGGGNSQRTGNDTGAAPQRPETVGTLTRLSDGREFSLGFGSLRIGRQGRADLVIEDPTVSRHHADVCYESGRYVVYDHSSNGTWINEEPVPVARALRDSDTIKFGEVEFRFSLKALARGVAPPPPRAEIDPAVSDADATQIIREGKRRRRRRVALLLAFVVLLLFLIFAGLALYLLFPGLTDRMLELAPTN